MYSLLPALVSGLFLGYGVYVLAAKGFNRISLCFFALCLTTFFWQATWAVLFQVRDPFWTTVLIRLGYLLIIFLPTTLYHFLVEIANQRRDRRWVMLSYGLSLVLGGFDVATDLFVAGYYGYFFGHYPKAGPLHVVHVLQTVVVVGRGLFVTWQATRGASFEQRVRLNICVASLFVYFFAAVDYLCNYGFEFYPPGVFFLAISLGLIAVVHRSTTNPLVVAASVAHEIRVPLDTIRMQADTLMQWLPELCRGYSLAVDKGLVVRSPNAPDFSRLPALAGAIRKQVDRSSVVVALMLASADQRQAEPSTFVRCSMDACLHEAMRRYPFQAGERDKVVVDRTGGFEFIGSESFMVCVLLNLLKNALYAIRLAGKGEIDIGMSVRQDQNLLTVRHTGVGIRPADLPHVFDTFFTSRPLHGAGLGLSFCRGVIESFGGSLVCESAEGRGTTFRLHFPPAALSGAPRSGQGSE